ncbi:HNH endonuclease signature motif containing protein [Brevibacterium atlanticum]|uniref:HNH endonuclease signature motif containing protein n=1 Tax=Brevibacterium atlanticum TaxID=2697563 RepID=UPI001D195333|nr:HNH endonuclease signature motif containing protein [Brevibacterium atlanticum]
MKDSQDPHNLDDDDLNPASDHDGEADETTVSPSARPIVGSDSPRRLDVDPDSPMAVVASIARLSSGAKIAEYQAVASLFLAEVIDRLRYAPANEIYYHATFTQTAERFLSVRDGGRTDKLDEDDPWAATDSDSVDSESREASTDGTTDPAGIEPTKGALAKPLPNFPKFQLHKSFNSWAHELTAREEVTELAAVLGATSDGAYNEITNAITLVFGLPKFLDRCLKGEFTIEHVLSATRAVKDVSFEYIPRLDAYLAERRADITLETFRKSLNLKIAAIVPVDDRTELASKRRHVDITTYPDGTASVTLMGPAVELKAFYLRIEAFARAIRNGQISAFTDVDLSGLEMDDQDSIAALMFDIATRATPQMAIAVTAHDTTTGETTTKEFAFDTTDSTDPITADAVDSTARTAQREAEAAAAAGDDVKTIIKLVMPTHGQWVREQAKMMVSVPYLTAIGRSELPGTFSDGAPVPPEAVRVLAAQSPTWHRILTDPATGTPIDARSKSYYIPADVRAPLTAKWQSCSAPGCTRRAETSEIDHIIPFDHDDPARGGQTTFTNTHPLCKADHQRKTDRRFSVRSTDDGAVEYAFRHGVVTKMYPPDNPINAEHARQVENYAQLPNLLETDDESGPEMRSDNDAVADVGPAADVGPTAEGGTAVGAPEGRQARRPRETDDENRDPRWDRGEPPPF